MRLSQGAQRRSFCFAVAEGEWVSGATRFFASIYFVLRFLNRCKNIVRKRLLFFTLNGTKSTYLRNFSREKDMDVTLSHIDKNNYQAVCQLELAKYQEELVVSNTWSLIESFYHENTQARALCLEGKPVGFIMWEMGSDSVVILRRIMVDYAHQRHGIGRCAIDLLLAEMASLPAVTKLQVEYPRSNRTAKAFFSALGFEVEEEKSESDILSASMAIEK